MMGRVVCPICRKPPVLPIRVNGVVVCLECHKREGVK